MKGRINKIETTGLVDGPGIRYVVFMQECALRCIYCHNPETWKKEPVMIISPRNIIKGALKYKNYICKTGGITFSGGEPILQDKFLIKTLKLARKNNIHTCIDTSGHGIGNYKKIIKYTDLIILDIKGTDDEETIKLTGFSNSESLKFIEECNKQNKKVWIRYVIIPNINDKKENVIKLNKIILTIKNVTNVELLPYHSLGKEKYENLKIKYKLENTEDMSGKQIKELEKYLKGVGHHD